MDHRRKIVSTDRGEVERETWKENRVAPGKKERRNSRVAGWRTCWIDCLLG